MSSRPGARPGLGAAVGSAGRGRPRVVASDLDGTLLRADGTVGEHTARVWSALPESGVETVVVTARPPRWLHHLAQLTGPGVGGAPSLALCANGAFVYDVARQTVLERHGFAPRQARDVVAEIRRAFPDAAASFETDRGAFRTPAYADDTTDPLGDEDDVVVCHLDDVPDDVCVGKVLLRHHDWVGESFVAEVTAVLGDAGVLAYSGAHGLAEITAPGVTKAARLSAWCEGRSIDARDVWAFGDMPNDIPMLNWAGWAVAVENAHPDVLAMADAVCGSHDAEGVAHYLVEELFPGWRAP